MNGLFSEAWARLLSCARDEAMRTGWWHVTPDHLMLALLRFRDNPACHFLADHGIDPDACKAALDRAVFAPDAVPYDEMEKVLPDEQALSVLNLAGLELMRLGMDEHLALLSALLQLHGSFAESYLSERGLAPDAVRAGFQTQKTGPVPADPDPVLLAETLAKELLKSFSEGDCGSGPIS